MLFEMFLSFTIKRSSPTTGLVDDELLPLLDEWLFVILPLFIIPIYVLLENEKNILIFLLFWLFFFDFIFIFFAVLQILIQITKTIQTTQLKHGQVSERLFNLFTHNGTYHLNTCTIAVAFTAAMHCLRSQQWLQNEQYKKELGNNVVQSLLSEIFYCCRSKKEM